MSKRRPEELEMHPHDHRTRGSARAWRVAIPVLVALLAATSVAAAPEGRLEANGAIVIALDEGVTVRDYVEAGSGEEWTDALGRGTHSADDTEGGMEVRSDLPGGKLARSLHLAPEGAVLIWRLSGPEKVYSRWRLGVRLPAAALRGARCQSWLFHARADQLKEFTLSDPAAIPAPLNERGYRGMNTHLKSLAFASPARTLRADVDCDWGSWQLNWVGDELLLEFQRHLAPGASVGAVLRLQSLPAGAPNPAELRPLQLADWLARPFSITPSLSKRGFYHPGEPVELRLSALALRPATAPVPVRYRLTDYLGEEVSSGEASLLAPDARADSQQLRLKADRLGMFRLAIEAGSAGELRKELTFGVVPEPQRLGPDADSVFATHAILYNPYYPELAAQMGMRWTRLWGGNISNAALWRAVEPEPGEFRWYDDQIALARGHRLNILGLLGGRIPAWVEPDPAKWSEDDLSAWSRYVYETVSHYREQIKFWEVWNEPYWTFRADAKPYVRLLRAAYEAAKRADPECQIVGTCGPPWSSEWYEDVFAEGGLEFQDIVSAHLYPPGGGHNPLDYDESFREFVRGIRETMAKHGPEKELWDTEAGMGPASPFNRLIKPHYFRHYGTPVPVGTMTDMAARLYIVHLVERVRFFYYLLHGSFEYDSALCESSGDPLPAAAAIAVAGSLLDGSEFVRSVSNGAARAYAFKRGNDATVAVWGVGLAGRTSELKLGFRPRELRNVMGNPCPADGGDAVPVSPSPVYMVMDAAQLDTALAALEAAPPPELDPLAAEQKGLWDELLGPSVAVDVTNFEAEPVAFEIRVESLPPGWELGARDAFGRQGRYVVHRRRRLLFPVALGDGAEPSGEVALFVTADGREKRYTRRIELPRAPTPAPAAPHQPPAELMHQGIEFVTSAPWTVKIDNSGLREIYRGPDPLLTGFYFYVARRGLNAALLSFRDCSRNVEPPEVGSRLTLLRENPPRGTCELTVEPSGGEALLRWRLSVPPTEEGWGELGFYVPQVQLDDGYPSQLVVAPERGEPKQLELAAEIHPLAQLTGFRALRFATARGEWGLDFDGARFPGSHGWHFQDFRMTKGHADQYRVVLAFNAEQGFEADIAVRVWSAQSTP